MGQTLDRPHITLVQRVPFSTRMGHEIGLPIGEYRQHVAPDRISAEGIGEAPRSTDRGLGGDRVDHVRGDQHRHGRALALITCQISEEGVADKVRGDIAELTEVLEAMGALPLRRIPLPRSRFTPARKSPVVGLLSDSPSVGVGLEQIGRHSSSQCFRWGRHVSVAGGAWLRPVSAIGDLVEQPGSFVGALIDGDCERVDLVGEESVSADQCGFGRSQSAEQS